MEGIAPIIVAALGSVAVWTFLSEVVKAWLANRSEDVRRQMSLSEGWGRLASTTQEQLEEERTRAAETEERLRGRVVALETENAGLREQVAVIQADNAKLRRELEHLAEQNNHLVATVEALTRRVEKVEKETRT